MNATARIYKPNAEGYLELFVNYRNYKQHRLAWLYVYGTWPDGLIDHINNNKLDNRIANLRVVDDSKNSLNKSRYKSNKSGIKGVFWHKSSSLWYAQVQFQKQSYYVGSFRNLDHAAAAVRAKREELHGEFARHE